MDISSNGSRCILMAALMMLSSLSWGMRCGTDLVRVKDLDYEVIHKCGAPNYVANLGYTLTHRKLREYRIERWIYEQPGSVIYVLEFIGGELTSIDWRRSPS